MAPGPLEDISLGKTDAPNTIVEYASMTCPHCAQFHTVVLPELDGLEARYRRLWPARYRPGGLEDSAGRMRALKGSYADPD